MISVVTAYYNRKAIFHRTLTAINASSLKEFEVIAVDDGSNEFERLEDLQENFKFLKVIRLPRKRKWYKNPCIPFNIGFSHARGDIVVIQNPECFHAGDLLKYTSDSVVVNEYLNFACYSLSKQATAMLDNKDVMKRINSQQFDFRDQAASSHGDDGWYNHPVFSPRGYHFCSALKKKDLDDLGGFDERYALGIGYDDDEFYHRIKTKGMRVRMIETPVVLHQDHYDHDASKNETYFSRSRTHMCGKLNRAVFEQITKKTPAWQAAEHRYKNSLSVFYTLIPILVSSYVRRRLRTRPISISRI